MYFRFFCFIFVVSKWFIHSPTIMARFLILITKQLKTNIMVTPLMKTATEKLILTAKGEVNKNFRNALMCASYNQKENKIYPCRWMKSGRRFACSDKTKTILDVLKAQGYKYEEGNDAPKGGLEGNYIKVSKTAFTFLQQFRNWN